MNDPDLTSYRLLRQEPHEQPSWIVVVLRMPGWVHEAPRPPYRPHAVLVLTKDLGINLSKFVPDRDAATALLLPTLVQFATSAKVKLRPARIVTTDPDTQERLRTALGDLIAEVKTMTDLPPLEAVKQQLASMPGPARVPDALSVPGVTRDDLRTFARAAADFHRAAPWRHLNDHDLIRIDSPRSPDGQKYAVILGAGGQTFGLAFYSSLERYNLTMERADEAAAFLSAPEPLFSVLFNSVTEIAFGDHDLWEEESLPLAHPDAYPFAAIYDPLGDGVARPRAALLNHATAVLSALALTTEEEMDTARWTKTVETPNGPIQYTLSIPELLNSVKKGKLAKKPWSSPINPDAARQLAYDLLEQATDASGRRQIQLARKVIELDPDNGDAISILARRAGDPARRLELLQQAIDAGRRAIGDQFDSLAGHFWLDMSTRPYMRARAGLAMTLRNLGRHAEALEHFFDMLRLNPNDNQGIRDLVPATLLALGRDREVLDFTAIHGRGSAVPAYAAALATFRIEGNSPAARKSLANAITCNRHVPHHLVRGTPPPSEFGFGCSPGQPSEAAYCIGEMGDVWRGTPGAVQWLAAATPPPATRSRRRRR